MDIAHTVDQVSRALEELSDLLKSKPPSQAFVSVVPPVEPGKESLPVEIIEPALFGLTGPADPAHGLQRAVDIACNAFTDLQIHPDWSQKASRRYPGVLWYTDDDVLFTARVTEKVSFINRCKEEISNYIIQFTSDEKVRIDKSNRHLTNGESPARYSIRNQRFLMLHNACPGIMSLHLYRQLRCFHAKNIEGLRFTWQNKTLVRKADVAQLLTLLRAERETSNESPLEYRLRNADPDMVRIRRTAGVQPIVNLSIRDDDFPRGIRPETQNAPLPFIVIQNERPVISPIAVFQAGATTDIRGRRKGERKGDKDKTEKLGQFHGEDIELVLR